MKTPVTYPQALFLPPAYTEYPHDERTGPCEGGEIRVIRYVVPFDGRPTRVFAYLGIPEGIGEAERTAPAVLLLHGGAGSAYREWVAMWTRRGYVALAPDLEGREPYETATLCSPVDELRFPTGEAVPCNVNYTDTDDTPLACTWMYYATSVAIAGNSLLHALPMTRPDGIGVCGVSWGGVITAIVTGYDSRFAFSIPIYCALHIADYGGMLADDYRDHPAARIWDDDSLLSRSETPILLVAADNDFACDVRSVSDTFRACRHACLVIKPDLLHSQYHASVIGEPYLFADAVLRGEEPCGNWLEIDGVHGILHVDAAVPAMTDLHLAYTDRLCGVDTVWNRTTCHLSGAVLPLPAAYDERDGYLYAYATVRGWTVSSPVERIR